MHTHISAAAPSKPTKPDIIQTTTNSIKLSFSVEFGSQPITHFYLNVTQSDSGSELQKTFSIEERKYVESLTEKTDEATGVTIGYDVVMFVTGLSEREKYEFEVAAESSIGMGEFSEPSESTRLGESKGRVKGQWKEREREGEEGRKKGKRWGGGGGGEGRKERERERERDRDITLLDLNFFYSTSSLSFTVTCPLHGWLPHILADFNDQRMVSA